MGVTQGTVPHGRETFLWDLLVTDGKGQYNTFLSFFEDKSALL